MYPLNPNPYTAANNIWANSTYRTNGIAAGCPSNFWVANPDVNNAYVVTNGPKTSYNGMQLVLNRRFARGLMFQSNYTYGKGYMDQFYSFHKPYVTTEMNYTNIYTNQGGNATGNVRHAFAGQLGVRAAVRPRQAVRHRRQRPAWTASSAAGASRAWPGSRAGACWTSATCAWSA